LGCRLNIWFDVREEARFLSHRDMMRLTDLASGRAGLPRRFSQGFNPHPKLMLPLPRPVGVAARGERAVVELTEAVDPADAAGRLARQFPPGVTVTGCESLPAGPPPQALTAEFALPVDPARADRLTRRRDELADRDHWTCRRPSRKRGAAARTVDLKRLVQHVDVDRRRLTFTLVPDAQIWARAEEVLGLLGLDGRDDLAKLCRLRVDWSDTCTPPTQRMST